MQSKDDILCTMPVLAMLDRKPDMWRIHETKDGLLYVVAIFGTIQKREYHVHTTRGTLKLYRQIKPLLSDISLASGGSNNYSRISFVPAKRKESWPEKRRDAVSEKTVKIIGEQLETVA